MPARQNVLVCSSETSRIVEEERFSVGPRGSVTRVAEDSRRGRTRKVESETTKTRQAEIDVKRNPVKNTLKVSLSNKSFFFLNKVFLFCSTK